MLLVLAGIASGTMWVYDDPTFFMMGQQNFAGSQASIGSQFDSSVGYFKPGDLSPIEIINAPYFPLLTRDFSVTNAPVKTLNATTTVMLGSTGKLNNIPQQLTFSGGMENNLKYAQSKSSVRIGQEGSWTNLNNPWLI